MSRSYRKFPISKDGNCREKSHMKAKDFANRAVRRSKEIPSGRGGYKKIYCGWFICDSCIIPPSDEKEFKRQWESKIKDITIPVKIKTYNYKEALWEWKKWYIRK